MWETECHTRNQCEAMARLLQWAFPNENFVASDLPEVEEVFVHHTMPVIKKVPA